MIQVTEQDRLVVKPEDNEEQPVLETPGYGTFDAAQAGSFQNVRSSIAAGMMDLSLFIANCNQLANVIRTPDGITLTTLEKITTGCIIISIFLQIFVVLMCIWSPPVSKKLSSRGIVTCIFLILVVNVFVACLNNENQHINHSTPVTPTTPPPTIRLLTMEKPQVLPATITT